MMMSTRVLTMLLVLLTIMMLMMYMFGAPLFVSWAVTSEAGRPRTHARRAHVLASPSTGPPHCAAR